MKEHELRKHATCTLCERPIGHTGVPLFWRVTLEQYGVDLQAVQRQDGLTAMLGGHALLASHMGPNEDLAKRADEPVEITICHDCALDARACVYEMRELAQKADTEGETP